MKLNVKVWLNGCIAESGPTKTGNFNFKTNKQHHLLQLQMTDAKTERYFISCKYGFGASIDSGYHLKIRMESIGLCLLIT